MTQRSLTQITAMVLLLLSPPIVKADEIDPRLRLGRGVNILGYDGIWKGEIDAPFRKSDFSLIRQAGFDHVRINFFGLEYMDSIGLIDAAVLARLDKVIDEAARAGLTPVLDQHDNRLCQERPHECRARLDIFWRQIARHYAGTRPRLVFEILNEPGGDMSPAEWNAVWREVLRTIRAFDHDRVVIIAAPTLQAIGDLALPEEDRNLIVTVHYYEPFAFTHQGAVWLDALAKTHDIGWGATEERERLAADLGAVQDWAAKHGRQVYLGEFGVYDKAPEPSRSAWTRCVARTAEALGWSWAYWQFDHDFALFDSRLHRWNRPLLNALMR